MSRRIYLDAHATTPADPEVVAAMLPFLNGMLRQSASPHPACRWPGCGGCGGHTPGSQVADLIGAGADEIVFTSGATESNNLAIQGPCPRRVLSAGPGRDRSHRAQRCPGSCPGPGPLRCTAWMYCRSQRMGRWHRKNWPVC